MSLYMDTITLQIDGFLYTDPQEHQDVTKGIHIEPALCPSEAHRQHLFVICL